VLSPWLLLVVSVVAWGCGSGRDRGQCSVPEAARHGVIAIAAGGPNLALLADGSVVAWGCGYDQGPCRVPASAKQGVIAIAAGGGPGLALKAGS
jgi:hypothetical protein